MIPRIVCLIVIGLIPPALCAVVQPTVTAVTVLLAEGLGALVAISAVGVVLGRL